MEKSVVWGMIGCGDVTQVKNGPGLYLAKNSRLKAITNRTISKATDWALQHNQAIVYSSVEALLGDPEIDIVYIAVTPDKHMEYALMCAKAGKHCLIEKPVAMSYEEGVKIKEAFERAGKKAFVAFYRRAMNRFQKVIELVQDGSIGELQTVNITRYVKPMTDLSQWRADPKISGGNVFTETDIHILDFLDLLLGNVENFRSISNSFAVESQIFDGLSLSMKYKNGCIVTGQWNYNSPMEVDRVELVGTEGMIVFDFFHNNQPIRLIGKERYEEFIIEDSPHVGLNMEQQIVDELRGEGSFSGTIDAALRSLLIADTCACAFHFTN